jgi:hypothetical protein
LLIISANSSLFLCIQVYVAHVVLLRSFLFTNSGVSLYFSYVIHPFLPCALCVWWNICVLILVCCSVSISSSRSFCTCIGSLRPFE